MSLYPVVLVTYNSDYFVIPRRSLPPDINMKVWLSAGVQSSNFFFKFILCPVVHNIMYFWINLPQLGNGLVGCFGMLVSGCIKNN